MHGLCYVYAYIAIWCIVVQDRTGVHCAFRRIFLNFAAFFRPAIPATFRSFVMTVVRPRLAPFVTSPDDRVTLPLPLPPRYRPCYMAIEAEIELF